MRIKTIVRGLSALLLAAALCQAAANAQADITDRAVEFWQADHAESGQDAYRELMAAFEDEVWDGWSIAAIAEAEERFGASVLERNGARTLALLQKDEAGWRVTECYDALLDEPKQAFCALVIRSEEDSGAPFSLEVDLYEPDGALTAIGFSGEPDAFVVEWFTCTSVNLTCEAVSEVRILRPQSVVLWAQKSIDGLAFINVDAYQGEDTLFSTRGYAPVRQLHVPIGEASISGILSWMGECIAHRNDPPPIPESDTFPQPQLASFKKKQKLPVYTGPGTDYLREADGKATVSTSDWIQIFGEENGWLLIQYHVSGDKNRFGYIKASQAEAGVSVPRLSWKDEDVVCQTRFLNTDPIRLYDEMLDFGLEGQRCTLLGSLAEFDYLEVALSSGEKARGFVMNASGEAVMPFRVIQSGE